MCEIFQSLIIGQRYYCQPGQFVCGNLNCIDKSSICNQYDDCGDNSDEDPKYCSTGRIRRRGLL